MQTSPSTSGKLEKWLSSPLKPHKKSLICSGELDSRKINRDPDLNYLGNLRNVNSSNKSEVLNTQSPFTTPPSLSCHDKVFQLKISYYMLIFLFDDFDHRCDAGAWGCGFQPYPWSAWFKAAQKGYWFFQLHFSVIKPMVPFCLSLKFSTGSSEKHRKSLYVSLFRIKLQKYNFIAVILFFSSQALIELLDKVEDVISVKSSEFKDEETNTDAERCPKADLVLNHLLGKSEENRSSRDSNFNFLVLEVCTS